MEETRTQESELIELATDTRENIRRVGGPIIITYTIEGPYVPGESNRKRAIKKGKFGRANAYMCGGSESVVVGDTPVFSIPVQYYEILDSKKP